MKKLVLAISALLVLTMAPAHADGRYRHGHHHHHRNYNWIPPLVGGAIIGGIIVDQYRRPPAYYPPPPVYYPPPTVYYEQPPVYVAPARECRQYRRVDAWGNVVIVEECF